MNYKLRLNIFFTKIFLIFTFYLYRILPFQFLINLHYNYYEYLLSNYDEEKMSEIDIKKLNNKNPEDEKILYQNTNDMYYKFNNYIINHNKKWSSLITFTKSHYAILLTKSSFMNKKTPVIKVIKNFIKRYDSYSYSYKKHIEESKDPETSKIEVDENKKLHVFMIQTHLQPDYIAECFKFTNFNIDFFEKKNL